MAAFQKPPTVSDDYRAVDIYRAAAKIIFDKGFDATSMGDIAESVDLTKGGLYYYIKGKKAMLFAIMNFAMDRIEKKVMETASEEKDPAKRLARIVSNHVRLVMEEAPAMTILVYEEEGLDPEHYAKIDERKRAYSDFVRSTIQAVFDTQDAPPPVDPVIATFSLLGMIHWIVRWYEPEGHRSEDEVVEQITALALHGLAPRVAS